jgi:hypothetical protein
MPKQLFEKDKFHDLDLFSFQNFMGTNYYLYLNVCSTCNREEKALHIGKSSGGWYFALHVTEEITSLDDWKKLFKQKNAVIKDEYGKILSQEEMLNEITNRSWKNPIPRTGDYSRKFMQSNSAEFGGNNLIRAKIDGAHCIGHGEGTWDYITGEFS